MLWQVNPLSATATEPPTWSSDSLALSRPTSPKQADAIGDSLSLQPPHLPQTPAAEAMDSGPGELPLAGAGDDPESHASSQPSPANPAARDAASLRAVFQDSTSSDEDDDGGDDDDAGDDADNDASDDDDDHCDDDDAAADDETERDKHEEQSCQSECGSQKSCARKLDTTDGDHMHAQPKTRHHGELGSHNLPVPALSTVDPDTDPDQQLQTSLPPKAQQIRHLDSQTHKPAEAAPGITAVPFTTDTFLPQQLIRQASAIDGSAETCKHEQLQGSTATRSRQASDELTRSAAGHAGNLPAEPGRKRCHSIHEESSCDGHATNQKANYQKGSRPAHSLPLHHPDGDEIISNHQQLPEASCSIRRDEQRPSAPGASHTAATIGQEDHQELVHADFNQQLPHGAPGMRLSPQAKLRAAQVPLATKGCAGSGFQTDAQPLTESSNGPDLFSQADSRDSSPVKHFAAPAQAHAAPAVVSATGAVMTVDSHSGHAQCRQEINPQSANTEGGAACQTVRDAPARLDADTIRDWAAHAATGTM